MIEDNSPGVAGLTKERRLSTPVHLTGIILATDPAKMCLSSIPITSNMVFSTNSVVPVHWAAVTVRPSSWRRASRWRISPPAGRRVAPSDPCAPTATSPWHLPCATSKEWSYVAIGVF